MLDRKLVSFQLASVLVSCVERRIRNICFQSVGILFFFWGGWGVGGVDWFRSFVQGSGVTASGCRRQWKAITIIMSKSGYSFFYDNDEDVFRMALTRLSVQYRIYC